MAAFENSWFFTVLLRGGHVCPDVHMAWTEGSAAAYILAGTGQSRLKHTHTHTLKQ